MLFNEFSDEKFSIIVRSMGNSFNPLLTIIYIVIDVIVSESSYGVYMFSLE